MYVIPWNSSWSWYVIPFISKEELKVNNFVISSASGIYVMYISGQVTSKSLWYLMSSDLINCRKWVPLHCFPLDGLTLVCCHLLTESKWWHYRLQPDSLLSSCNQQRVGEQFIPPRTVMHLMIITREWVHCSMSCKEAHVCLLIECE